MPRPWIVRHRPRLDARIRLYCVPHAGAGASAYHAWARLLPHSIEVCAVQPPGRESRLAEAPPSDLNTLASAIADAMGPTLNRPFAIFGHSYGAWLAFELARRLGERWGARPVHLFVSGRRAPRLPSRHSPIHALPDPEFLTQLEQRYGGIPSEILQHQELTQVLLPSLRADLTAVETYVYRPGPLLQCQISAFGGIDDESVTQVELESWQEETTGLGSVERFPGAHFYLTSQQAALLRLIADRLENSITHPLI